MAFTAMGHRSILYSARSRRSAISRVPPAVPRASRDRVVGTRVGRAGTRGPPRAGDGMIRVTIVDWTSGRVRAVVPAEAVVGPTTLVVRAGDRVSSAVPFEVLPDGVRHRDRDEPVALADDDIAYTRDLLAELKTTAESQQDAELVELAARSRDSSTRPSGAS